jgi:CHAT domain-containing protein
MASGVLKSEAAGAADRGFSVLSGRAGAKGWTHPYYWASFILIGNWK